MSGYLIYRCMRCGLEIPTYHCEHPDEAVHNILHGIPQPPGIKSLHICPDGNWGVTDLVGFFEKLKKETT